VYVRHLSPPSGGDAVVRLADPVPREKIVLTGQWWPPVMLSPSWVLDHHDEFDVFHIQFGFDAQEASCLSELARALRSVRKPLVYTVHDLRNPHHADRRAHDAHLDVLISQSDGLITLTAGAAAEVQSRWGRRPVVLPHPHVIELDRIPARRRPGSGFVVGCTPRACARAWPRCRSSRPWRQSSRLCPARGCRSTSITTCLTPAACGMIQNFSAT